MATSLLRVGCFFGVGVEWVVSSVARLCSLVAALTRHPPNLPPRTGQRPFRGARERARLQGRLPRWSCYRRRAAPRPRRRKLSKETRPPFRRGITPPSPASFGRWSAKHCCDQSVGTGWVCGRRVFATLTKWFSLTRLETRTKESNIYASIWVANPDAQ